MGEPTSFFLRRLYLGCYEITDALQASIRPENSRLLFRECVYSSSLLPRKNCLSANSPFRSNLQNRSDCSRQSNCNFSRTEIAEPKTPSFITLYPPQGFVKCHPSFTVHFLELYHAYSFWCSHGKGVIGLCEQVCLELSSADTARD